MDFRLPAERRSEKLRLSGCEGGAPAFRDSHQSRAEFSSERADMRSLSLIEGCVHSPTCLADVSFNFSGRAGLSILVFVRHGTLLLDPLFIFFVVVSSRFWLE